MDLSQRMDFTSDYFLFLKTLFKYKDFLQIVDLL